MDDKVPNDKDIPGVNSTAINDLPVWVVDIIKYAATDPWGFIYTLLLYLSPLFLMSAFLSWKLMHMIEAKEKEKKKASTKAKNKKNVRRKVD